jgi:hypothetical protein
MDKDATLLHLCILLAPGHKIRSIFQDGVRPRVISVQKVVTAFFVAQFCEDPETRADPMGEPHRPRETDVKSLWKLTVDAANMDVAMQSGPALAKRLNNNGVIGLCRHRHMTTPSQLIPVQHKFCEDLSEDSALNCAAWTLIRRSRTRIVVVSDASPANHPFMNTE